MSKKLLFIMSLTMIPLANSVDSMSTNLMLMNNYSYRQSSDIWQRMRAGFKLTDTETARVKYFEKMYTKNPQAFNKMMTNALPYLYYILVQIERKGLPSELALVPGVESTFNPFAVNPTDAYAGMWQFVPSTGKQYKMEQTDTIDERRDIVKSTNAALEYFMYLYELFQQWDVAIGAYNWGQGNMYRAVLNSKQKIGKVKYTKLQLRNITADYVPKVIALANIIKNPAKFGVVLPYAANEPYFAITNPLHNITVKNFRKFAGLDEKHFVILNPQYKTTSFQLNFDQQILLPQKNKIAYYAKSGVKLPELVDEEYMLALTNTSQGQEVNFVIDASSIASENNKSINNNLVIANSTTSDNVNNELKEEDVYVKTVAVEVSTNKNMVDGNYVMIDKANLDELDELVNSITVAGVTTTINNNIYKTINKLDNHDVKIEPKPNLKVALANKDGSKVNVENAPKLKKILYKVNIGDTLYSIARRFNTQVKDILEQNHMNSNKLAIGQVLTILASN